MARALRPRGARGTGGACPRPAGCVRTFVRNSRGAPELPHPRTPARPYARTPRTPAHPRARAPARAARCLGADGRCGEQRVDGGDGGVDALEHVYAGKAVGQAAADGGAGEHEGHVRVAGVEFA